MRRLLPLIFGLIAAALLFHFFTKKWLENHLNRVQDQITVYGNVDVRQVDLGFSVEARLASFPYEEGDVIPKGTLIARVETTTYANRVLESKAQIASTEASLLNAEQLVKRRKELLGTGGISEQEYDDAVAALRVQQADLERLKAALTIAQYDLDDTELFAPNDGILLTRIREPGSYLKVGEPICTLSLLSPVWVRTFVSEPELGLIYPGMKGEIHTDSGSQVYQGHVGFISPVAEFTPKTVETTALRTDLVYRIRVVADNPDHGLRQGMPVTVVLFKKSEP